jgi:hypothetical protein
MDNKTRHPRPRIDTVAFEKALTTDDMRVTVSVRQDGWLIAFQPRVDHEDRPTRDAWLTLEWVAWLTRDMGRADTFFGGEPSFDAYPHAAPPGLNEPGHMFTLCVASDEKRHPLADFVATYVGLWNDDHESPKLTAPATPAP